MSEWGDILAALEVEVRQAIPSLPAGDQGFERGLRRSDELATGELPHVFAHDPTETADELGDGWRQLLEQKSWQLDLWVQGWTQEQVAATLDAIRDEIRGNPTLGGLVDFAFVSTRGVVEASVKQKDRRAGVVIVRTRKVVR